MRLLLAFLLGMAVGTIQMVWAGPYIGEQPVYSRDQGWEDRYFYVASGNGVGQVEYHCRAQANTATAAASWSIRRFTYDSSNRVSVVELAGGNDAFDQNCDNRATLSY